MIETTATSVDEYINTFPEDIRKILREIRLTVNQAAPEAGEAIKYHMPTLIFHGNMLSYGVYKKHIGLYPAPSGDDTFNRELSPYRSGKASVRFPLNEPLPLDLISQIVKLRVKAMSEKTAGKARG